MKTIQLDGQEYSIRHDRDTGSTFLESDKQDLEIPDLYKTMRDEAEALVMDAKDDDGRPVRGITRYDLDNAVSTFVDNNELDYVNASYHRAKVLTHE